MTTLVVQPRPTPAERASEQIEVEVEDALKEHAEVLEEWTANRQAWDFVLREGTEFGRANNVECRLLCVAGEASSSLSFRLDQLEAVDDTGASGQLVLRFEERDGIAKLATLTESSLDVELFHILTYT
jgi:uncharacterized protein YheU (UPF0270 family)